MSFLKNCFSRITSLMLIYRIWSQIHAALQSFPGFQCEVRLRAWLLDHLTVLSTLAIQTENTIDDAVLRIMKQVIENDKTWLVVFRMIYLAEPLLIAPTGEDSITNTTYGNALEQIRQTLEQDEEVKNPLLILSAVGLLLQIIQILRMRYRTV